MYPPIFAKCFADAGVKAIFGTTPCRIYPFGEAPQDSALPYAVWRTVGGDPANTLSCVPDIDVISIRITVYAETGAEARTGMTEIRDAIEPSCHVTGFIEDGRDLNTRHYMYSMSADWWVSR